jgi:hypothetical protein
MRHVLFKDEQHLSQRTIELRKQMTELGQLRELVRLAEAAEAACNPVNSKVVDRCAGAQPRV